MKVELEILHDKNPLTQEQTEIMAKIAEACIDEAGFAENGRIDVYICDNAHIRRLNKENRGIDDETDVLSFPMAEMHKGKHVGGQFDFDEEDGSLILGDIVICAETAMSQADLYGHSLERELAFLTAHGAFHLLGYSHETKDEEQIMEDMQENILEKFNLRIK